MVEYNTRIGEIVIGGEEDKLVAIALGSCVVVVIFDIKINFATMAHVALPGESYRNHIQNNLNTRGRFADSAIKECRRILEKKGGKLINLRAKIAGGSRMFETSGLYVSAFNIGDRNIKAVIENLKLNKIRLVSKDIGGNCSRTVKFLVNNNVLNVKKGNENYDI